MNDCSISSEQHSAGWIGGESFAEWLVLILVTIFIQYDTKMIFELTRINSIHSPIKWMTEVSVINDIMIFAEVE